MWDCFTEPGFMFEVIFRCLPSILLWAGFSFLLKFAADWF